MPHVPLWPLPVTHANNQALMMLLKASCNAMHIVPAEMLPEGYCPSTAAAAAASRVLPILLQMAQYNQVMFRDSYVHTPSVVTLESQRGPCPASTCKSQFGGGYFAACLRISFL